MRWITLALVPALVLGQALAQSSIFDNCRTVITDGLREYSILGDSASYLNTVQDKYCERSGSAKSQSLGVGLDLVTKSLPIRFTGSFGSNNSEEAIRNFCRNYASFTAAASTHNTYEERIVQLSIPIIRYVYRHGAIRGDRAAPSRKHPTCEFLFGTWI